MSLIAGFALLSTAALGPESADAAIVYLQTIVSLATVSTLDDVSNCRDSQGCLGKTGQVFDAGGNALAIGNLPDTLGRTAAADGTINVLLNPTDDVGRLKVFSLSLQFATEVPEPASSLLLASGIAAALPIIRRKRDRASNRRSQ